MGMLNFAPVDKAFLLGSNQIKSTQEEIENLKKLLSNSVSINKSEKMDKPEEPDKPKITERLEPNKRSENDLDYNLLKVIGHPKFDDFVKNYVLLNHPEWINKRDKIPDTAYVPGNVSYFGNRYASSVCSDVRKYISFFVICMILFIFLSLCLDKN